MKKLNLVFNTSGKAMTVSLTDPKEGLTLEECRTAAEKLQVVLSPSSGETVTGFEKATVVTTTTVNIDNGFGAGYVATQINRLAEMGRI